MLQVGTQLCGPAMRPSQEGGVCCNNETIVLGPFRNGRSELTLLETGERDGYH